MVWQLIVAAVIGYLLGAIPGGYVMGRLTRGIDVRNYGSGKTGATNALRTLSLWAVLAVLVIDLGKSAAAVSIARVSLRRCLGAGAGGRGRRRGARLAAVVRLSRRARRLRGLRLAAGDEPAGEPRPAAHRRSSSSS